MIGTALADARHARGQSIAQVSEATKIQPWVLEALEANQLSGLMSPIYVRGFLTSYAKHVGLDPQARLVLDLGVEEPGARFARAPEHLRRVEGVRHRPI